jgi:uncharacterized protein (TIGR03118 family)
MNRVQRSIHGSWWVLVLVVTLCGSLARPAAGAGYQQYNLVSDGSVPAAHTDPNLINPWGIVFNPNGPAWIANNGTGVSTLYDGQGVPQPLMQPLVVIIPTPPDNAESGNPTGIVFNGSMDFVVSQGGASSPAVFLFASENGTIAGWSPMVDRTHAILAVDNSPAGAIYKGLALAANGTANFLYATDFHHNKIDVFDAQFHPATLAGTFTDPDLPASFAPFGIRNLNGDLYVTYAQQDEDKKDDVPGKGLGLVDVFDANGRLIRRFASGGRLNAPWGLALAPADFGPFSNRLLVGNFGDGRINAFDLATGRFLGRLRGPYGRLLTIDGLWGISFGNGVAQQPTNVLFFAAGPQEETQGLYGRIEPTPGEGSDGSAEDADMSE